MYQSFRSGITMLHPVSMIAAFHFYLTCYSSLISFEHSMFWFLVTMKSLNLYYLNCNRKLKFRGKIFFVYLIIFYDFSVVIGILTKDSVQNLTEFKEPYCILKLIRYKNIHMEKNIQQFYFYSIILKAGNLYHIYFRSSV